VAHGFRKVEHIRTGIIGMKPSTSVMMILGGLALLFALYQTKMMRGPVMYVVALAIYGLVLVNFQEIQSQIGDTFHPNKKA
jgi:membrane-bound ClpP family serine protease